ncbi:MAG: Zn-dependent alcohol dehydrogenase [Chloroflexi bacterium]|nr:Zn-dependent alcohol dehydrogenase [Chloroflexota bacterium]
MKAAVLYELGGRLEVEEIELAAPKEGEVLVKVVAAGVCHSDISVIDGVIPFPLPTVLGHEGSGVVESVGPGVDHVQKGDHVIFSFIPACGQCFYCLRGMVNLCEPALRLGGNLFDGTSRLTNGTGMSLNHFSSVSCFAEYTVVPRESAIKIDPEVPLDVVALIGCCVTTGAGAVFNTAKVPPGSSVAVFGCGGVGLSIVQGAAISGAQPIIALDLWQSRLDLAMELGATHTINASTEDGTRVIRELTGGKGVDFAFEAIGNPDTISQAYRSIHWGGTCVCVGVPPADAKLTFDSRLIMQERTIKGSLYGSSNPKVDFANLVALYSAGKLKLDQMITGRFPLERINGALEDLRNGIGARSVIVFD